MTPRAAQLVVAPERCDQCGRCVPVCVRGALRVGGGYIYVDASACDGCLACADACRRQAITRRSSAHSVAGRPNTGGRVVVGSRAEAKELRNAAADVQRRREGPAPASGGAKTKRRASSSPRADSAAGYVAWNMLDAGAVLAVMMASLLATDAIAGSAPFAAMPPGAQTVARSAVLGSFCAIQIGALALLSRRHGFMLADAFGLVGGRSEPRSFAATAVLVVALTVATRAASTLWGVVARTVGWTPPDASGLTSLFGGGGIGLLLAVIMLVFLGPFVEELAFRGVLLRAVGARWGKWPAILGTAAVFAAYHVTLWTLMPLFVLGVALGWLAWSRRSLWAVVWLHALYNGVVVAAAYWLAR